MKRPLFLINGVNDVKITELHFHGKKHLMPKGQVEKRPSKNHFLQNVILKSMSLLSDARSFDLEKAKNVSKDIFTKVISITISRS